ncbi:MAG: hypothetical protein BWY57_02978 [Betaproteobacteria bacterium ADurb.Bin341]|nr:MAG: hypothetical protein BWY57_02978 [Betaproteobacteria bacterium ADurb.Bin341]
MQNNNPKSTLFALMLIGVIGLAISIAEPIFGVERTLPAGTCADARIVEFVASGSTVISPYWTKVRVMIEPADGVTEKFRVAIGSTTVDTDFPMRTSFDMSFRGSVFLSVQTATDTANFLVTQVRED